MKTSSTLLFLISAGSVVLGHKSYSDHHNPHPPSSQYYGHSQHHEISAGHLSTHDTAGSLTFETHSPSAPILPSRPTIAPSSMHDQAHSPSPLPTSHVFPPTTGGHPYPIESLAKRTVCVAGGSSCLANQVCCPAGSYCTTDSLGNGACCENGAACIGVVTSMRGSLLPVQTAATAALPVPGAANLKRPAKAFVALTNLMRFGLAMPPPVGYGTTESTTDVGANSAAAKPPLYQDRGGLGFHAGGGSEASSGANMPRPLKVFAIPVVLAKRLSAAAIFPVNKFQDIKTPLPAEDCGAPFCSAASHAMANPLRYPVWLVGQVLGLFRHTISQGLYYEESALIIDGLVPVSAHVPLDTASTMTNIAPIAQTISAAALQDSRDEHDGEDDATDNNESEDLRQSLDFNDGYAPTKVNISEKLGGYAPVNEKALNSTASSIQSSALRNVLRQLRSTVRSFGWTFASRYAYAGVPLKQSEVANAGTGCHGLDIEDESSDYAKNACEGLGVGSALMTLWGRVGA
ncbi:hypothetical protein EDD36DRAFT_419048 [Exophiala viscosa]|uniref:Granulins domain-containing protein n=1 Tax=Exophiala viscosa TaxID=2486360 RepID=A0AAN6ICY8_9EURO|nr:hypothetical protein EDD36DRAFT_419048 [Exophiala viscosa]